MLEGFLEVVEMWLTINMDQQIDLYMSSSYDFHVESSLHSF
jgi:hypothetical protein